MKFLIFIILIVVVFISTVKVVARVVHSNKNPAIVIAGLIITLTIAKVFSILLIELLLTKNT